MLRLAFDKCRITFTEGSAYECTEWLVRKQSICNIKVFPRGPILSEIYLFQLKKCHSDTLNTQIKTLLVLKLTKNPAAGVHRKQKFLFPPVRRPQMSSCSDIRKKETLIVQNLRSCQRECFRLDFSLDTQFIAYIKAIKTY